MDIDDNNNDDDVPLPPFFFDSIDVDDEEDEAVAIEFLEELEKEERQPKLTYKRLNWTEHMELKVANDTFKRYYHMTPQSFKKLVSILHPLLAVDLVQSSRSSCGNNPISVELVVGMGI